MTPKRLPPLITTALLSLGLIAGAQAHAEPLAPLHSRRAEVQRRGERQDKRIKEGVQDGTLGLGEANDLKRRSAESKGNEKAAGVRNGADLSKGQQRELQEDLSDTSKKIYQDKHNQELND